MIQHKRLYKRLREGTRLFKVIKMAACALSLSLDLRKTASDDFNNPAYTSFYWFLLILLVEMA